MLDIKYILQNKEQVLHSINLRNVKADVDLLIKKYNNFKALKTNIEQFKAEANNIASQMAKASKEERDALIKRGAALKNSIKEMEEKYITAEALYHDLLLTIPNTLPDDTPQGLDDQENIEIKTFMEPTKFDFTPKDHVTLGQELDLIDFENGAKVAGSKFYFLKNELVLLEMALKQYAILKAAKHGFIALQTPDLARNDVLAGSGYAPRGNESNTYRIEGHDLSLIATAEIAVGGYHAGDVFDESVLPIKYAAESHCFRTEAGGAGRASKGLYRVHQFSKIELYAFAKPEQSDQMLEEIRTLEESIYQDLKLPYRVMRICAGDLGAPAYMKYDIEAWMPSKDENGGFGEITSASNCTDFQARRLNIRYKNAETGKNEFVHTLNGTAIALSRTLIAIMENYQTKDGEILIPEVLKPFLPFEKISKIKTYLENN
jgi:seryl-tRNA synthetase